MPQVSPIQAFSLGADAVYLSKRPLPIAPDGRYDWEASANANLRPEGHSGVTNLIKRVSVTKRYRICPLMTLQIEAVKAKGPINPDPRIIVSNGLTSQSHFPDVPTLGRIRG